MERYASKLRPIWAQGVPKLAASQPAYTCIGYAFVGRQQVFDYRGIISAPEGKALSELGHANWKSARKSKSPRRSEHQPDGTPSSLPNEHRSAAVQRQRTALLPFAMKCGRTRPPGGAERDMTTHSGQTAVSKAGSQSNPGFAKRSADKRPLATSPDRPGAAADQSAPNDPLKAASGRSERRRSQLDLSRSALAAFHRAESGSWCD